VIDSHVRANFHQRLLCVVAAAGSAVATLCASLPAGAANPPGHVAPNRVIVGPNTAFRFAGRISPDTVPFFRDYHDFSGTGSDGNAPVSELIADSKGNLYGTTEMGGSYQNGTLYRITLPTSMSGNASYKTLHSFKPGECAAPEGAVLIGSDGAFYGTTNAGGMFGDGTVYRIDPTSFTLKTLHIFREKASAGDGYNPSGGLTVGPGGLLYGTTGFGGAYGYGTVFAISPKGASVSYSTIHSFGAPGDGAEPYQGRLVSSGSYLYGMTESGGTSNGFGVVYEMVLSGSTWNETVLHQFGTVTGDAYGPTNGLAIDTSGNLYGCGQGGHYAKGAVFELTPSAGSSGYRIIESFGAHSGEPSVASCALVLDSTGRLIGTSSGGGTYGEGTVFRLTGSGGAWTLSTRFSFGPVNNGNPYAPDAPLLGLGNGYYAGTAVSGGAFGYGAMFEIKP
jgi:uncharacterized repeat protein (TIGR03803 family)